MNALTAEINARAMFTSKALALPEVLSSYLGRIIGTWTVSIALALPDLVLEPTAQSVYRLLLEFGAKPHTLRSARGFD